MEDSRCKQNVTYYYKVDQPAIQMMQKEGLITHLVNKPPTEADFIEKTEDFRSIGGSIVICDDFSQEIGPVFATSELI